MCVRVYRCVCKGARACERVCRCVCTCECMCRNLCTCECRGGGSVVGVGVGVCALTRTRTHYSGARHKPAWGRIVWTGHVDMMTITVLLEVCEGTLWGMGRKPS